MSALPPKADISTSGGEPAGEGLVGDMEVPSGRVITLGARAEVYSLLGGWSSLLSQPVATSEFSGSGRSQSRHCMMRLPLPPGGNARIKNAPQSGRFGRSA